MSKQDITDEFNLDVQKVYLEWFISEPEMFTLCRNIIKPEYFDSNLRGTTRFILEYADQFAALPMPEQIKAKTGTTLTRLPEEYKNHSDWLLLEIERFCKTKALENAVYEGVTLIKEGRGGELEKRIKDAMTISLMTDLGTNYYRDSAYDRLKKMRDHSSCISTGWKDFDKVLFGGCSRGTLNIFLGKPGEGKSLLLQNLAVNYAQNGHNVVYFSLELKEDMVSLRLDAMNAGISTVEVMRDIEGFSQKHEKIGASCGELILKKLPESGTTVNDFKAFMKEYEIKTGKKFDVIIVDYLDLLYPTNVKIDPSNLFVKDKYTSEELRSLAFEFDAIVFSASQINRSGTGVDEFDYSHIAGGISKINTADNIFAIFAPDHFKEQCKLQIQFLKTRTSKGVGQKMLLDYNPDTMRITDKISFDKPDHKAEITDAVAESVKALTGGNVKNFVNALNKQK